MRFSTDNIPTLNTVYSISAPTALIRFRTDNNLTATGFRIYWEENVSYNINVYSSDSLKGSARLVQAPDQTNMAIIGAFPITGYRFVQWTDGNKQNPRPITVTQDTSFTAVFGSAEQGVYHVSASANNTDMGSVAGGGDYSANSTVTIGAIANTGYRFVQWNDGNMQNPRTLTLTQDTNFIAVFGSAVQGMYHVLANANNTDMGSVIGSGDYSANSTVTIGAIANTGYRFVQWNDGNMQNPRTIILTQDTNFIAVFGSAVQGMYHVLASANNTDMGSVIGSGDYSANSTVTIGAIANIGYRFVHWHDGNIQNPRILTLTQDTNFTAVFAISAQGIYHVSVISNSSSKGSVTGSGDYVANTMVTINAIANIGYRFVQWNDGNTQNPRIITVIQDTAFIATFIDAAQNTYRITLLSNDKTKGIVMGGGDYIANSTITIGAIPNPGYYFVQWDDGNKDNPRTITVMRDSTFIASFEIATAIKDIEASTIAIYPNPATDNIHIVLPDDVSIAVFTLYDMQGKVLIRKEINSQDVVSVNNLAAGVYVYNVTTDKQNYTGKLIINN
jgi:hypothetical protein